MDCSSDYEIISKNSKWINGSMAGDLMSSNNIFFFLESNEYLLHITLQLPWKKKKNYTKIDRRTQNEIETEAEAANSMENLDKAWW